MIGDGGRGEGEGWGGGEGTGGGVKRITRAAAKAAAADPPAV